MVDTIRDRPTLLSLLANNITGDISPQDLRDVIVSMFGVYGNMATQSSTSQSGLDTTPVKLTAFTSNGLGVGVTPDHANDKITVSLDGDYLISYHVAFKGTAQTTFIMQLAINGVLQATAVIRKIGSMADAVASANFVTLVTLSASDYIEIFASTVENDRTITVERSELVILKIA